VEPLTDNHRDARALASSVRRASFADASAIASVLRESFIEFSEFYTRSAFAATAITSEEVCQRMKEGQVWVALQADKIVGTIAAVVRGKDLYVRGMAVVPSARGADLGRSLLAEVERLGWTAGHHRIVLSTTPFLTKAIRLYKTRGFQSTNEGPQTLLGTPLLTMTKSLRPTPGS